MKNFSNKFRGKNNKEYKKNSDFGYYSKNKNRSEKNNRFLNNSAKEECINERKEFYDSWYEYFDEGFEMKLIDSNYTEEEKMNYKGVVYEVTVDQKYCSRYNSTESWDCNSDYETIFL